MSEFTVFVNSAKQFASENFRIWNCKIVIGDRFGESAEYRFDGAYTRNNTRIVVLVHKDTETLFLTHHSGSAVARNAYTQIMEKK